MTDEEVTREELEAEEAKLKAKVKELVKPKVKEASVYINTKLEELTDIIKEDDDLNLEECSMLMGEYMAQVIYKTTYSAMFSFSASFRGEADIEVAEMITDAVTTGIKNGKAAALKLTNASDLLFNMLNQIAKDGRDE